MLNCLLVGLGGFAGAVCRYLVTLIPLRETAGFPIKTLCINVLGSLAIGAIAAAVGGREPPDPRWVLFLKVGLCGGFTTYSTFALESLGLLQEGRSGMALLYVLLSAVLGVSASLLGTRLVG